MANANTVRAVRLVYIRDLLREKPRTARELASLCDVHINTIYHDLIDLQLEPLSVTLLVDDNHWRIADLRRE